MPKAAKAIGGVDAEYPVNEIAHAIVATLSGRFARAS
jgi:chemotaxis response regulator CheB